MENDRKLFHRMIDADRMINLLVDGSERNWKLLRWLGEVFKMLVMWTRDMEVCISIGSSLHIHPHTQTSRTSSSSTLLRPRLRNPVHFKSEKYLALNRHPNQNDIHHFSTWTTSFSSNWTFIQQHTHTQFCGNQSIFEYSETYYTVGKQNERKKETRHIRA